MIRTRHVLINQRGERVFSLTKMSYFDPVAPACVGAIEPGAIRGDFAAAAGPAKSLRERMIEAVGAGRPVSSVANAPDLTAGQLILHPPVRPIGWSENLGLSTLLRNTHPLHFDAQRFGREDIVVCGGFVQAMAHAAGERELRQIVQNRSSNPPTSTPSPRKTGSAPSALSAASPRSTTGWKKSSSRPSACVMSISHASWAIGRCHSRCLRRRVPNRRSTKTSASVTARIFRVGSRSRSNAGSCACAAEPVIGPRCPSSWPEEVNVRDPQTHRRSRGQANEQKNGDREPWERLHQR